MELSEFAKSANYDVNIHYQVNARRHGSVALSSFDEATSAKDLVWKNYDLPFSQ